MKFDNYMILEFPSKSTNEAFARSAVACFAAQMDPTLEELGDIRTAVSEAVTNAIIHGYEGRVNEAKNLQVEMTCLREESKLTIIVEDHGVGMKDVAQAREPFFTTKPEEERSGMGFAFMEAFMDDVQVQSEVLKGTTVILSKRLLKYEEDAYEG